MVAGLASGAVGGAQKSDSVSPAGANAAAAAPADPAADPAAAPAAAGDPNAATPPTDTGTAGDPAAPTGGNTPANMALPAAPAQQLQGAAPNPAANPPDPNPDCTLIVPADPLSAKGLATPYRLVGTGDGGACHETTKVQSAFVQAAIVAPNGFLSLYNPLVIDDGTEPAAPPVTARVPRGATVGIWFGFNGDNLTLKSADGQNSLTQGKCVNGLGESIFGQFAYCNAPAWFRVAHQAINNGRIRLPRLGKAADGLPCPTVRDFSIVDQDQSDNVNTHYLAKSDGTTAQPGPGAKAGLTTDLANGSDNRLLAEFVLPTLKCKNFTAPEQTNGGKRGTSLPLQELMASQQQSPVAYVPLNDPMTLIGDKEQSKEKTNLFRAGVDQPPVGSARGGPSAVVPAVTPASPTTTATTDAATTSTTPTDTATPTAALAMDTVTPAADATTTSPTTDTATTSPSTDTATTSPTTTTATDLATPATVNGGPTPVNTGQIKRLWRRPFRNASDGDPSAYCSGIFVHPEGLQRVFAHADIWKTGKSANTAAGDSLFTFLASRAAESFGILGCETLLGEQNPIALSPDTGVATGATFMDNFKPAPGTGGNNGNGGGGTNAGNPGNGGQNQPGGGGRGGRGGNRRR
jgi:hypothetical protein